MPPTVWSGGGWCVVIPIPHKEGSHLEGNDKEVRKLLCFKSIREDSRIQKCVHLFKILKFQILKGRFATP